ncbi:hypothetical protein D2V08_15615 [Flagellimonas lutimaris]|uniref:Uncharacterized protein n=1 Tax=Flagellimonas lutimaris TaxID=475082 RepID=A0A3A1N3N0_9FLAO|nr:hypothetical protein [Allomuricauda lutimaris]RIV30517.1 hypothetical protein D2V08_15615 [Allomuricauda lutimaris]
MLSCKAQKDEQSLVGEKIEDMELVDHDDFTNIEAFDTRVIRDGKSLRKFYAEINKTRKPGLPVPIIDFSKETVILVCLGEQRGRKTPMLSKLKETDNEISIAVEIIKEKQQKESTIQSIYFPFYLYKMPLVDKTITFQKIDK